MPRLCQVSREGTPIGEHDEQTLLALLNAGSLRLSDTYWRRGMKTPATLADLLCGPRRRSWMRRSLLWMTLLLAIGGAAWALRRPVMAVESPDTEAAADPLAGYEIRRGTEPVADAAGAAEKAFPEARTSLMAAHSRVAVLAQDEHGQPLALGSGVVVEDGQWVLASLQTLAGASRVEVELNDGTLQPVTQVVADRQRGAVALRLPVVTVPVRWCAQSPAVGQTLAAYAHPHCFEGEGELLKIFAEKPESTWLRYDLTSGLPASGAGAALVDASGALAAVLTVPEKGIALRATDARALLQTGELREVASLKHLLPADKPPFPIAIEETELRDGQVFVTLRNNGPAAFSGTVLHIACYAAPQEMAEVRLLEQQLRLQAVEQGGKADNAKQAALSDAMSRLDSARQRLRQAMTETRRHLLHHALQAVDCDLLPGAQVRFAIELDTKPGWCAEVQVLDAG